MTVWFWDVPTSTGRLSLSFVRVSHSQDVTLSGCHTPRVSHSRYPLEGKKKRHKHRERGFVCTEHTERTSCMQYPEYMRSMTRMCVGFLVVPAVS